MSNELPHKKETPWAKKALLCFFVSVLCLTFTAEYIKWSFNHSSMTQRGYNELSTEICNYLFCSGLVLKSLDANYDHEYQSRINNDYNDAVERLASNQYKHIVWLNKIGRWDKDNYVMLLRNVFDSIEKTDELLCQLVMALAPNETEGVRIPYKSAKIRKLRENLNEERENITSTSKDLLEKIL